MKQIETLKLKQNGRTKKEDIWYLCLREATKEELNELKAMPNVEIRTGKPQELFKIYSRKVPCLVFEEDKYDYYTIQTNQKRTASVYSIRVAK